MSHKATNWAIQQRGLKPATKLLLWHLCDRHNPDLGCFPSQERLADDCEMARSTVQAHIEKLVEAGLMRCENGVDPETKRQLPTRYTFAFEEAFATADGGDSGPETERENPQSRDRNPVTGSVTEKEGKPGPKNSESRDRNPVSNLVREPLREPCARGDAAPDGASPCASGSANRDGAPGGEADGSAKGSVRRRLHPAIIPFEVATRAGDVADNRKRYELVERRFVLSWLFGKRSADRFDFLYVLRAGLFSMADFEAAVLSTDGPGRRTAERFVRWAYGVARGEPQTRAVHPDVKALADAMCADGLAGEGVRRRCEQLLEGAPEASCGDDDAGSDDHDADVHDTDDTERSEASASARPQRPEPEGRGIAAKDLTENRKAS